jgi:hypothetical protein
VNPWTGKWALFLVIVAVILIRAPHGKRSKKVPVARSERSTLETFLLALVWLGTLVLPLVGC